MSGEDRPVISLFEWLTKSDFAACEIVQPRLHVFLVRTNVGAEHFFARISIPHESLSYLTVSDLLDIYSDQHQVALIS